jgi:hypothetical protein
MAKPMMHGSCIRTFYLADAYRRVTKPTEAVALYGRAREAADRAIAALGSTLPVLYHTIHSYNDMTMILTFV